MACRFLIYTPVSTDFPQSWAQGSCAVVPNSATVVGAWYNPTSSGGVPLIFHAVYRSSVRVYLLSYANGADADGHRNSRRARRVSNHAGSLARSLGWAPD